MSYSSLADEIVLQIINFMPLPDLESFSQINKRTYFISVKTLEPRQALKRNAKFIAARFSPNSSLLDSVRRAYNPDKVCSSYEDVHLDYLNLNGDLHWLDPLDEVTKLEAAQWGQYHHSDSNSNSIKRLDELVTSGKRVGVEFPPVFLKFMASTDYMDNMYLGGSFFSLGPGLIKCRPKQDNNGGGYMIQFFSDQQGCGYWHLYLAPGGYHCVLYTPESIYCWKCAGESPYGGPMTDDQRVNWLRDHEQCEVYEGIDVACRYLGDLEIELQHPNLEAWLAVTYFGVCGVISKNGRKLTEGQKRYLEHFSMEY